MDHDKHEKKIGLFRSVILICFNTVLTKDVNEDIHFDKVYVTAKPLVTNTLFKANRINIQINYILVHTFFAYLFNFFPSI